MPFKEVWKFTRSLDPKNMREWEDYCDDKFLNKLKKNISMNPKRFYSKSGWVGSKDLLKGIRIPECLPLLFLSAFFLRLCGLLKNSDPTGTRTPVSCMRGV